MDQHIKKCVVRYVNAGYTLKVLSGLYAIHIIPSFKRYFI